MKKIFSKEVIIGLIVIASLVVLFIGIDFLKGANVFQKENTYYITYENVQGLSVSAPVTVNGYKVGLVRDIAYQYDNPGHVRVDIDVDDELRLPEGTTAVLSSDLLGTATIALDLGTSTTFLKPGSELTGVIPAGLMDAVSQDIMPSLGDIFPKVDSILSSINVMVADPALLQSIQRLDVLTANLVLTTQQLNAVMSTLPPISKDIKQITGNFVTSSEDINALTQRLSQMPLDSVINTLQLTLENLRVLTDELNNGLQSKDSSLGKLLNDPALYDNLNSSVQSLDSLFIDIKKNPKRYINIKLL